MKKAIAECIKPLGPLSVEGAITRDTLAQFHLKNVGIFTDNNPITFLEMKLLSKNRIWTLHKHAPEILANYVSYGTSTKASIAAALAMYLY